MCIFKRLFKNKKEKTKEPECWYNNAHEQKKRRWNAPDDGATGFTPNQHDNAIVRSMAKRQH